MEKTKVLEVPAEFMEDNWKSGKVTIKRLSYSERLDLSDEAMNLRVTDAGVSAKPSQKSIALGTILKAVIEAPWQIQSAGAVLSLDWQLGDWLLNEINSFNTLSVKKKEDSSPSSGAEQ